MTPNTVAVSLTCPDCGPQIVLATDVELGGLAHPAGTVIACWFPCPSCHAWCHKYASPGLVQLLLELGIRGQVAGDQGQPGCNGYTGEEW